MNYEYYYNERGEMGVLISEGFGAGWSTWNEDALAYDKRIIEKWLQGVSADEMQKFCISLGYKEPFMGGYNLELVFVPKGTTFYIHEYDGSESIKSLDKLNIHTV